MKLMSRTAATLAGSLLFVAMSGTAVAAPATNPPSSGCQAGADVLSADALASLGYVVGPAADVNGDDIVCGKPFSAAATAQLCPTCTLTFYNFSDNTRGPKA